MSENNDEIDQEELTTVLGDTENQSEGRTESMEKYIDELKS